MENNNLVQEEFIKIELWSRPLKSNAFSYGDVRRIMRKTPISDSGAFIAEIKKKNEGTGILQSLEETVASNNNVSIDDLKSEFDLGSQILEDIPKESILKPIPSPTPYTDIESLEDNDNEDSEIKKPKKISLKVRISRKLYDYSEIEQEELEEKIADLINRDGYYNEVIPIDEGMEFDGKKDGIDKRIVAVLIALGITTAIMIYMFKTMF